MKKLMITLGLTAVTMIALPAGVSAHSYNGGWSSDADSHQASAAHVVLDRSYDRDCSSSNASGTIVDELVADGRFTTLVAAVKAAGLVDALNASGDKTVFAPTDEAFAALPAGTVEALLADIPTLTKILTYHVVAAKVDSDMAIEVGEATMLNGQLVNIGYGDDGVYVNDSKLVQTDIGASNGVIHAVDAVLMPQL